MTKKRSFTQLKKTMSLDEFNKFCKKLTEQYAKSEPEFARTYFTEYYNISQSAYYKVMEYAVITDLVPDSVVYKMMNKALANVKAHSSEAGIKTKAKYARMWKQRCDFIAMSYTDEEVKTFAEDFARCPEIPKADMAAMYGMNRAIAEQVLVRAIVENIIDDETVIDIRRRSINNSDFNKQSSVSEYFCGLFKLRVAKKEGTTIE